MHQCNKFNVLAVFLPKPPLEEANDDLVNRNLHSDEDVQSQEGSEDVQSPEESEGDNSTGYSATSYSDNKYGTNIGSTNQELKRTLKRKTNGKVWNAQPHYYDTDVSKGDERKEKENNKQ